MEKTKESSDQKTRWWESYFVRYLLGTITGAILIFIFNEVGVFQKSFSINTMLLDKDKQYFAFMSLGICGFAYCYISSGPMLVFHSIRGICNKIYLFLFFGGAAVLSFIVAIYYSKLFTRPFIAVFLYMIVVLLESALVVFAIFFKSDELYYFYKKLTVARGRQGPGGYIESYRHMREHGNSILIVPLEVILGAAIIYIPNLINLEKHMIILGLLSLWIVPAGLVWFVSNILEYKMISKDGA